ncbi:MAG: hypothetical protein H8E97_03655 [Bacteroidetes bacterium]|jgi:CHASE2 domain-containing sensor protein|nr:hypothetical protein [Bacteroidota bacterium]MDA0731280.1 hypothetical protein [Bacteroidota bacterium]MDA0979829.1 hypothetical protein [Bacteroidota bacterium]|tara:strand:- start:200 stop:433 length:234 start_codon:yes stop_codon:yes gene_type:complete
MEPKKVLSVTRAAEKFWLFAAISAILVTCYFMYSEGWEKNKFMPLIPALTVLWYFIRRTFRKRLELDLDESSKQNNQ